MAYTHWPNKGVGGEMIRIEFNGKPLFNLPLGRVLSCVPCRNEVVLGIREDEDSPIQLAELRFLVQDSDKTSNDKGAGVAVSDFCTAVKDVVGDQGQERGPIFSLGQVSLSYPRGRFDIKMTSSSLSLHGRSYSYQILFSDIKQISQLHGKNRRNVIFMLQLEKAIGQGATRYNYVMIEFPFDEEVEVELQLTDEQLDEYGGELDREMQGPTYDVLSKVFRSLIKRDIVLQSTFLNSVGEPFVECVYRQNPCMLYPLDAGLMAVAKPPLYIAFGTVSTAFIRSDYNTRFADLCVTTIAQGTSSDIGFTGIPKGEMMRLEKFLRSKDVKLEGKTDDSDGKRKKGSGKEEADAGDQGEDENEEDDYPEDDDHSGDEDDSGSDYTGEDSAELDGKDTTANTTIEMEEEDSMDADN